MLLCINFLAAKAQDLPKGFIENETKAYNSIAKGLKEKEFNVSLEEFLKRRKLEYIKTQEFYKTLSTLNPGQRSVSNLCDNGTFETGDINITDWNFFWSGNDPTGIVSGTNRLNTGSFNTGGLHASQVHHQVQSAGPDPHFPALNKVYSFPAGNTKSLRLGNANVNCGTEKIAKKIVVTAANAQFSFSYAVVMDNPVGHGAAMPFFEVNLIDASNTSLNYNTLINLGNSSNRIVSDNPLLIPNDATQPRRWKNWTCVTADLTTLIGKTIIIEFVNRDCWACGHWAYTYIDNICVSCNGANGDEGSMKLNIGKTDTCGIPGKICLDYTLPVGTSPSLQLKLDIIQNGTIVNTLNSPVLTSGNNYCFTTNNTGLSSSLSGFDYKITGYPKLGAFALSPKIIGNAAEGVKTGRNDDYKVACTPSVPCEVSCCIPPALTTASFIRKQFQLEIVDPVASTFRLRFSPTTAYVNLVNTFDSYNLSQLQTCNMNPITPGMYKATQQFQLWEITNPTLNNASGSDILNTHIHVASNRLQRHVFYGTGPTTEFQHIMQPNKWYAVQYGFYFEPGSPFKKCGYNGATFAIKISDTGNMRLIQIESNIKEEIMQEKNPRK